MVATTWHQQLTDIAEQLGAVAAQFDSSPIQALERAADEVGKAWSGSWLGYHARVYYADFASPPSDAHFSIDWGFRRSFTLPATTGDWRRYRKDEVVNAIRERAGNPDMTSLRRLADAAAAEFDDAQARVISILSIAQRHDGPDDYLRDIEDKVKAETVRPADELIRALRPTGQMVSRDEEAIFARRETPPHINVWAQAASILSPFDACETVSKLAQRAANHLKSSEGFANRRQAEEVGMRVFIGHGHSSDWRALKDFVQDRLQLQWDEYNRVATAGVARTGRLSEMLAQAAFAFLVLTAEDDRADGGVQARQNVVHEVGLFQGRLGFTKAIVLLEDGCDEFSNIEGLDQLRYSKGRIQDTFEEVRRVLQREGLISG